MKSTTSISFSMKFHSLPIPYFSEFEQESGPVIDSRGFARSLLPVQQGIAFLKYKVQVMLLQGCDCLLYTSVEMLSNYDCINSDWFESQGRCV